MPDHLTRKRSPSAPMDPMRPHPLSGPGKWVIGGKTLRDTVALIDADFRGLNQLKPAKEGLIRTLDLTRARFPFASRSVSGSGQ